MKILLRRTLTVFIMLLLGGPVVAALDSTSREKPASKKEKEISYLVNPATWIDESYNHLNALYIYQYELNIDTNLLFDQFREHQVNITILKNTYYNNPNSLNIRSLYNLKMRVISILEDITKWQHKIHKTNEVLVKKTREIEQIKHEIDGFREKSDTIFRATFEGAVNSLSARQQNGEKIILLALKKNTAIENKIVDISSQVYVFYTDVSSMLEKRESSLIIRELPAIWQSPPSIYPAGIRDVMQASLRQTADTLRYYGEMSIWRIIIFRVLLFVLCLIPIRIFNHELRKKKIVSQANLTYLDKYPKTASLIMGMALAPFIFVHPPHAFMELIFIGITFTVTMLTIKIYPDLNKTLLFFLIGAFLVLYMINFFVTPTFYGRLIYTASILLLIPLFKINKLLPSAGLHNLKTVRFLVYFLVLHLLVGWGMVVWGNYTLGRSIILSAYSLLVFIMILKIAILTLLDYIEIIGWFFNHRYKTVQINTQFAVRKTRQVLMFFAYIFIAVVYLYNLNLFDLVLSNMKVFMVTTRKIGNTEFTLLSFGLFFAFIYLSFILATLIRNTFEPQHEKSVEKRSRLGSYLLLLRLMILCAGFVLGILASGLPLTNFTIFLGAMGVGIGFGLQNIISNLVSGIIIAFERPFVVGDVLDFGNETGKVKEISLRATMVSTTDGADILIPNNALLSENLKNWTISNKQRFIEQKVQTTHEVAPPVVLEIIGKCLDEQNNIVRERSSVMFSDINETGFVFTIKILINDLANGMKIKSQLLTDIQIKFSENNIRFPKRNYPNLE